MEEKTNHVQKTLHNCYETMAHIRLFRVIRESLIMIAPVIMVGAFTLVCRYFPLEIYQQWLHGFADGIVDKFLEYIYQATFGILSLFMLVSLSASYAGKKKGMEGNQLGAVFASLLTFCIASGLFAEGTDISAALGTNGLFTAIVSALFATSFYGWLNRKIHLDIRFYTPGTDEAYYDMFKYILPILFVGAVAAVFNLLLHFVFGVDNFQEMYVRILSAPFNSVGRHFGSMLLYVCMVHLLWFFGIHGGNVLNVVGQDIFESGMDLNAAALAAGNVPTEIYTKSFVDVFVLMGGCGSTLCLLLAIFLFEKKRGIRKMAKYAGIPGLFNINELVLFGVPIVFNPIMLIPFFLTPIACLAISTAAMKLGLVPVVSQTVDWTTPIFLGGYSATGSVAGAILQGINLCVGVMIYRPFVKLMDRENERDSSERVDRLVDILRESEETRIPVNLLELGGDAGIVAKLLSDDLEEMVINRNPTMYYQPQYDKDDRCIGAEALLRWRHPTYGMIYPPLVFKLLEEMGILTEAEAAILQTVMKDMDGIKEKYGGEIKISVNVTGTTIQLNEYEQFLREMALAHPAHIANIMLEVTEQASLQIDQAFIERLTRIRALGYRFAIDDFSMGSTSVKYLRSNVFDMIKLDGSLTKDVLKNERSRGIVRNMANMAQEFGLDILAEFVETREQQELLEELGCCLYQGYLYSPAVPLERFLDV